MRVKGFRGNGRDLGTGCAITEGQGIYIARTVEFARIFGPNIKIIEYFEPENPLIVDNECLFLLENDPKLFEPIHENDSTWTKLNKRSAELLMGFSTRVRFSTRAENYMATQLTKFISAAGHDAVRVNFRKMIVEGKSSAWDVLLNSDLIIRIYPHQELIDPALPKMDFCDSLALIQG